jgi:hypothetical protein
MVNARHFQRLKSVLYALVHRFHFIMFSVCNYNAYLSSTLYNIKWLMPRTFEMKSFKIQLLLLSPCLYFVRLSECSNSGTAERVLMKLHTDEFASLLVTESEVQLQFWGLIQTVLTLPRLSKCEIYGRSLALYKKILIYSTLQTAVL